MVHNAEKTEKKTTQTLHVSRRAVGNADCSTAIREGTGLPLPWELGDPYGEFAESKPCGNSRS